MTEMWALAVIFVVCFAAAIASTLALGWLERRTARADARTRHPAGRARPRAPRPRQQPGATLKRSWTGTTRPAPTRQEHAR